MKKNMLLLLLLLTGITLIARDTVWQLGKKDRSAKEFKYNYRFWEYGNAPKLKTLEEMNHKTHTFNYKIKENSIIPNPAMIAGLCTVTEHQWMSNDEIVTGVKLVWNEPKATNRKLVFSVIKWKNQHGGQKGIEINFPNQMKKIENLPNVKSRNNAPLKFENIFPVKAGKNELTIRIKSLAKHYIFSFDYIALEKTAASVNLPPVLESHFDAFGNIYHPGQQVVMSLKAYNLSDGKGEVNYTISNAFNQKISSGKININKSTGEIKLPSKEHGYFKVEYKLGKILNTNSYVVIEPVKKEYIDDSRFGCHALLGDGYRLRYWPERQELKMRRAFLAGAKWARYHRLSWEVVAPSKNKYEWKYADQKLAIAEKYKIRPLLNIGDTPKWASSSTEKKLTICGNPRYTQYPPKNWQDWADFVSTVVKRYKNKVKWYELWNEPGYSSAFWCNGSSKDFAKLLKVGYEAAKKVDPNCIILSGAPLYPTSFFEEVFASNGNKAYFDVMSVHYPRNSYRNSEQTRRWKSFLTKINKNIPLVNSEESTWIHNSDQLGFASTLLKLYIREAALGFAKTFAFQVFDSNTNRKYSAFDIQDRPLPQYAAFRTMTHRLERAKFIADLSSANYEMYLFSRQGTPVLVFWSKANRKINFNIGNTEAKLINIMDVAKPVKTANGELVLNATKIPSFIEGGDIAILTTLGKVIKSLPEKLTLTPGKIAERTLRIENPSVLSLKLSLPPKWSGSIDKAKLKLNVPKNTLKGFYEITISIDISGKTFTVPLIIEITNGKSGTNLIRNGNFSKNTAYWYFPKSKAQLVKGGGQNGTGALKTKGLVFFGCAGSIKVSQGEKYAVICDAKGTGRFGGVYTIKDKNGKKIFPKKPSINTLRGKLTNEWSSFVDVINIPQSGACTLRFAMLANYRDKTGNNEAFFDNFRIVRLTDQYSLNKVAYQGKFVKPASAITIDGQLNEWNKVPATSVSNKKNVVESNSAKWSGKDDLSASCQLMMDEKFLYIAFSIKDNAKVFYVGEAKNAWRYDSIQIAFDPTLEGKEYTEIAVSHDRSGKTEVFKHKNFWTPELPEGVTRHGLLKRAIAVAKETSEGMNYEIKIPLTELHPLTKRHKEFGFSWIINDNDGKGRKYIEWSSGIGGKKAASQFGLVRCDSK